MVISIRNNKVGNRLFNAQFWSDYSDENERFFIGIQQPLEFITIHDVPNCLNYHKYIRAINILAKMIRGYVYQQHQITSTDSLHLSALIEHLLHDTSSELDIKKKNMHIPVYIQRFFKHCCKQIKLVKINMRAMETRSNKKNTYWGYSNVKSLFFAFDHILRKETPNFTRFIKLFRAGIEMIIVFSRADRVFVPSISLDTLFLTEILNAIYFINKCSSIKYIFKQFVIVNPMDDINNFINEHQLLFIQNGWILIYDAYRDVKRNDICENTLIIKSNDTYSDC